MVYGGHLLEALRLHHSEAAIFEAESNGSPVYRVPYTAGRLAEGEEMGHGVGVEVPGSHSAIVRDSNAARLGWMSG